MARFAHWLKLVVLLGVMVISIAPVHRAVADVELPGLENRKGDKCVDDEDFIRRNHPDLLKHHRDEVVRKGIRTTKYSLKKCVECHASAKTGSVATAKDDFCVACHSYVGVELECWECHASKPGKPDAVPSEAAITSPMMTSVHTDGKDK
jgi:cytochrome c